MSVPSGTWIMTSANNGSPYLYIYIHFTEKITHLNKKKTFQTLGEHWVKAVHVSVAQQSREVKPILIYCWSSKHKTTNQVYCWATVYDAGPTVNLVRCLVFAGPAYFSVAKERTCNPADCTDSCLYGRKPDGECRRMTRPIEAETYNPMPTTNRPVIHLSTPRHVVDVHTCGFIENMLIKTMDYRKV